MISFMLQINDVIKIQAFIRANKARDDYKTLSKHFLFEQSRLRWALGRR